MPGTVRLRVGEVERIAGLLGMTPDRLVNEHLDLMPDRRGLTVAQDEDGTCVFLDEEQGCRVEAAKPQQCRDFPMHWKYDDAERICEGLRDARTGTERRD